MQTKKKDTQQMSTSEQEVLSRGQVAARLGVCPATVKRAEEQGLIVGIRLNGPRSSVRYIWEDVVNNLRTSAKECYVRQ